MTGRPHEGYLWPYSNFMFAIFLVLATLTAPNPLLTPGKVRPLTKEAICATTWGLDRRYITEEMKIHVAAAYGIPWDQREDYEFDHLIPRSLGGADDILNLWSQPISEATHIKDPLEVRMWKAVCKEGFPLRKAQNMFRYDWRKSL